MKIFALNLCFSFASHNPRETYEFEPISFEELMAQLFKGPEFPDQQFYVLAENTEAFREYVFDLQGNAVWRGVPLSICFLFGGERQLNGFLGDFREMFRETDAAGGLVLNERDEYLFIFNRKRWTLPKGGVEWREALEEAAMREVREETGLAELHLLDKMGESYHTFRRGDKWVLKTTHWYYMSSSSREKLVPQTEEYIEEVRWMSREQWLATAHESYPMVRHIMQQAFGPRL